MVSVDTPRTVIVATVAALFVALLVSPADAAVTMSHFPLTSVNPHPLEITPGPDGNMWFTELGANKIGKITRTGKITEFSLPSGAGPSGIVAGPDGNLWFTEEFGSKIGRITKAGVVTEFPLTTAGANPLGITAGSDGNLWFAESGANSIGRITTTGTITEFAVPTANAGLSVLTPGPDGNVWFTERTANKIGEITPSGTITAFALGGNPQPFGITAGPDGNLWFADQGFAVDGGNSIGRITTSGSVTMFQVPTADAGPKRITVGNDGNLWFTEKANGAVGRITTAGVVDEFPAEPTVPNDSGPEGVAPGIDGNIWVTEETFATIMRASTASAGTSYVLSLASGFSPKTLRTAGPGTTVHFTFFGPRTRDVTDTSALALFDSGTKTPGSSFEFLFSSAGTYSYRDSLQTAATGKVIVPVTATPTTGSTATTFTLTWASTAPATGFVFDVQVLRPGAATYVDWQPGTTATSGTFVPDLGVGKYLFRARLRRTVDNAATGFSSPTTITVA